MDGQTDTNIYKSESKTKPEKRGKQKKEGTQ